MSAAEFSLLAVTFGFTWLVVWVYSPGRRSRLESYGAIPLEEDPPAAPATPESRSEERSQSGGTTTEDRS